MPELDLTSGHFLGLRPRLREGGPLTNGKPAVLEELLTARQLGQTVARWQGADDGLVFRSSFHALLDVLAASSPDRAVLLVDEHAYPVIRWAAAAAVALRASHGGDTSMITYRHRSADDAAARAGRTHRPVVVITDGLCGSCLRPAPLVDLAAIARASGGHLVADDSLAAGLLGPAGAGTPASLESPSGSTVWVSSCAKAFAAPIAALAGSQAVVHAIRRHGPTRAHASQPSACDVAALTAALSDPTLDERRRRLMIMVRRLRHRLAEVGLVPTGVPFPQITVPERGWSAPRLQQRLADAGVQTMVTARRCRPDRALTLCLRADLADDDLERLLHVISTEAAKRVA